MAFLEEDRAGGRRRMEGTWQYIAAGLSAVLRWDPRVRPDAFTEEFTTEKFGDLLFSLLLSDLLRRDHDPGAMLEVVRRTVY